MSVGTDLFLREHETHFCKNKRKVRAYGWPPKNLWLDKRSSPFVGKGGEPT